MSMSKLRSTSVQLKSAIHLGVPSTCFDQGFVRRRTWLAECCVALARLVTPVFLFIGVSSTAVSEELIKIEGDSIVQIALDAVLLDNPDLMPGDLTRKNNHFFIVCSEGKMACFATVTFKVVSTIAKTRYKDEEGRCWEKETGESIDVQVHEDGSSVVRSGGGGGGKTEIDCNLI